MTRQIPLVRYLHLNDGDDGNGGAGPRLVGTRCRACGALFFDRRNFCARCSSPDFEPHPLERAGELRSFTIVHRAGPATKVPYVSSVVDLDGGGVVKANLVNVEPSPDAIELGMRVRLTTFVVGTDDEGTEAVAFGFEPEHLEPERNVGTHV